MPSPFAPLAIGAVRRDWRSQTWCGTATEGQRLAGLQAPSPRIVAETRPWASLGGYSRSKRGEGTLIKDGEVCRELPRGPDDCACIPVARAPEGERRVFGLGLVHTRHLSQPRKHQLHMPVGNTFNHTMTPMSRDSVSGPLPPSSAHSSPVLLPTHSTPMPMGPCSKASMVSTAEDVIMLTPGGAAVKPGDTRCFQYWFRDAISSNKSDGLELLLF